MIDAIPLAAYEKKTKEKARPQLISARELCKLEFPPIRYVVPGYIAEGLTLFAGKPKLGKSWFCMEIGLAVADGGMCLGDVWCEAGDVERGPLCQMEGLSRRLAGTAGRTPLRGMRPRLQAETQGAKVLPL